MSDSVKSKIYEMLEGIKDETILNQVMEEVTFYSNQNDVTDELTMEQLNDLDIAVKKADHHETIPWDDFKKELNEWRKK